MNIIPRGKYLLKVNIKDTRAKTVECHFKNRDTLSVNVFLLLSLGTWPQGTFKRKKLSRKKVLRSHDFQKSSRKFADTKHFDLYKLQKFILAKKRKIRENKKNIYIYIYIWLSWITSAFFYFHTGCCFTFLSMLYSSEHASDTVSTLLSCQLYFFLFCGCVETAGLFKLFKYASPFSGHQTLKIKVPATCWVTDTSQSAFTCSKLTIKTLGQGVKYVQSCHWRYSGVFIVNFEYISHFAVVFLLLTLNM